MHRADTKYCAMDFKGKKHNNAAIEEKKDHFDTNKWIQQQQKIMCSRRFWVRKLPIIGWLEGYNSQMFMSDVIAGLTVGLTVIPQGMACATIAGLPPQYGLYAAFMGCFVYMFFGSCKDITIGPTAISAMLVKPYVDKFGASIAVTICFCSGCFITLLGILQLGFLVDFISMPVIVGFTSAGAISIASSQITALLGVKGGGHDFVEYCRNVILNIGDTKLWDPVLGFSCIALLLILRYVKTYSEPRPGMSMMLRDRVCRGVLRYLSLGRNAIVVVISTVIIALIMQGGSTPVKITGEVEEGLPDFGPPPFEVVYQNRTLSFSEVASEMSSAAIIPFILVLESIAIAKAFAKGKTVDATQEMVALGLSNILGSFVQSFPNTGSFTRTAVNNASGVRTPIGGLFTGLLVLLALSLLTSSLKYLPKATLAAVVICAVIFMIEIHEVTLSLWRSKKADLIPLYATFLASLFIGLDYGMVIGIGVNLLFILYEAARPKVKVERIHISTREVLVVSPDRSITFPSAEYVKELITRSSENVDSSLLVVVDGSQVTNLDSTAVKVLKSLIDDLAIKNQKIVFWNWKRSIACSFVGYDKKNVESFRYDESLDQIVANVPELEKLNSVPDSVAWTDPLAHDP